MDVSEIDRLRTGDWLRFVDGRIAAAFAVRDTIRLEAMGEVIAAERQRHRDEIASVRADLEQRLDALAHELAKQRGFADGEIVDLPLVLRKRNAAA